LLIDKLPQRVQVKHLIEATSTNDSGDAHFSSHNEDRISTTEIPLISADDIMQLPKGQAFCLLEGGQLYKVRFPLPKNDMVDLPDVAKLMTEIN
jgi:hypothetical protein